MEKVQSKPSICFDCQIGVEIMKEFVNRLKQKTEIAEDYTEWVSVKNIDIVLEEMTKENKR